MIRIPASRQRSRYETLRSPCCRRRSGGHSEPRQRHHVDTRRRRAGVRPDRRRQDAQRGPVRVARAGAGEVRVPQRGCRRHRRAGGLPDAGHHRRRGFHGGDPHRGPAEHFRLSDPGERRAGLGRAAPVCVRHQYRLHAVSHRSRPAADALWRGDGHGDQRPRRGDQEGVAASRAGDPDGVRPGAGDADRVLAGVDAAFDL